jgi:hypothetical protein
MGNRADTRLVRRYAAYYFNWCQAFGEHQADEETSAYMRWLHGEDRIGVIVASELRKRALRALLGKHSDELGIVLTGSYAEVSQACYPVAEADRPGMARLIEFVRQCKEVHMYLTYHLFYPPGTRIITFSSKRPGVLFYKEIEPFTVHLL